MLDCVNVVKRYGGKFAVNGMSVAIEDAHIYGLLGAEWQRQVHMDEDGSRSDCPG